MSGCKKGITRTADRTVIVALNDMSKAALADLVIDLLHRTHGESVDGFALLKVLTKAAEPILYFRNDSIPASHNLRGLPK